MALNTKLTRCLRHKDSILRLVPGLQTLQEICYSKISEITLNSCRRRLSETLNFDENKIAMKEFFSQLPVTVREEILKNLSMEFVHGNYPFNLYLYELMFSTGMRKLIFKAPWDCRQYHIDSFFNLASKDGNGLRILKFDYMSYNHIQFTVTPRINQQLKQTLVSAEHLVDLQLDFICDDTIMKMIGENCTRLRNLDAGESYITAKGVHYLTQNFVRRHAETEEEQRVWKSTIWDIPGIFPPLEELLSEGEPVTFYERKKSPLCSTLKRLNISIDDASEFQLSLAILELIPNLESIGERGTDWFLYELWDRWYKLKKPIYAFPAFNLTSIEVPYMEEFIFNMLIIICPKLERIHYNDFRPDTPISFSLSSFNHLRYLQSMNIRHQFFVHFECFGDLSVEIRERLTEVSIDNPHAKKSFDISGVKLSSELRRLNLHFPSISWSDTSNGGLLPPHDTMRNLSFVNLQGKVTGKAVLSLLQCAPNLEYLTVSDIIERNEDFLQRILGMRKMPKLETFEVLEGFLLDTEDELQSFVTHFERIQHVGKIRFLSN